MAHIYLIPSNHFNKEVESLSDEDFIDMTLNVGCVFSIREFISVFNNKGFYGNAPHIRVIYDDDEQMPPTNKDAIKRDAIIDHLESNLEDSKEYWNNGTNKSYIVGWLQQTIVQVIKMLKQN